MKKIIIIGANIFQYQLVERANELKYQTHVFAWKKGAVAHTIADYFYPISIRDKKQILEKAKKIKPDGIVSIGSDLAVITVNYIAKALGLTGNSIESSLLTTNKFQMRNKLKERGLPCPNYEFYETKNQIDISKLQYPFIIKPLDRSGSRGVSLINNNFELNKAIKEIESISFTKGFLIEEYVEGVQYSVEMISFEGKHYFLAITEEFLTGAPFYVEYLTICPGRIKKNILNKVIRILENALDALGIRYGASHSEIRVDSQGNIKIIEIGARMGGDFRPMGVNIATGFDFIKMVIDVCLNKPPDFTLNPKYPNFSVCAVKWITNPNDLLLLKEWNQKYKNNIIAVSEVEKSILKEITNSTQRKGYIILGTKSIEECLKILKEEKNPNFNKLSF